MTLQKSKRIKKREGILFLYPNFLYFNTENGRTKYKRTRILNGFKTLQVKTIITVKVQSFKGIF